MKRTILAFDSWTGGASNFARIVPEIESLGYKFILLHLGSWGHDKGRPAEEIILGMQVRDIRYYRGLDFDKVLEEVDPVCVLFLSTRAFAHMAFLRYATSRNIPSCFLYCGLAQVQAVNKGRYQPFRTNPFRQFDLIARRATKNFFRLIPVYAKSLARTKAPLPYWIALIMNVVEKASGWTNTPYLLGTGTSIGCVFTFADVTHMNSCYRIPRDRIHVVGIPDLIEFGVGPSDLASALTTTKEKSREVIYIDTALLPSGLVFYSEQDYLDYLLSIRDSLQHQGYRLVFKPHPAHLTSRLLNTLRGESIELCTNSDFKDRVMRASAAIAEPSTAAMLPCLLGIPLFLSNLGRLADQEYGPSLTSYPLARHLQDLKNFDAQLSELLDVSSSAPVLEWIVGNSGPMPAGEMPSRVANAIDVAVRERAELGAN